MMNPTAPITHGRDFSNHDILGGSLALDFVNTVSSRVPHFDGEYINSYADLLNWAVRAEALSGDEALALAEQADASPQQAQSVYERAIALREVIHRIFVSIPRQEPIDPADLDRLNDELGPALRNLQVGAHGDHFDWTWGGDPRALDRMLWPVARAAADLLVNGPLDRVRECGAPDGCGWMFLDTSKNRSRRWCSMETCGNVAKARRHYRKQRAQRRGGTA